MVDDYYAWNGQIYTTSGSYTQYLTTQSGCDSIVTLHLTVNHSHGTAPFLLATPLSADTCRLQAFANTLDPNTPVSIGYSLFKNGQQVEIMSDECGGTLTLQTEHAGVYYGGENLSLVEGNIPANTFRLANKHFDYLYMHYLNGRENIVTHNFTEPGTYEVVFVLQTESDGNDYAITYMNQGEALRIGGTHSSTGGMLALQVVTFTVEGAEDEDVTEAEFPEGYPTLAVTRNGVSATTSLDTLTVLANDYDPSAQVALNYKLYYNGELMDYVSDYVSMTIETWYSNFSSYVGRRVESSEGSMPLNTFRIGSYAYDFFYLDYLCSTHSRVNATWKMAGDYAVVLDLVEMTGGVELPVTWAADHKLGGRNAQSTGLLLATDTLRYHVDETMFAAPAGVPGAGSEAMNFAVYPNPAREVLNVVGAFENATSLVVTDVNGKTVYAAANMEAAQNGQLQLNVSAWAEGVYFVTLRTERDVQNLKVVVTR